MSVICAFIMLLANLLAAAIDGLIRSQLADGVRKTAGNDVRKSHSLTRMLCAIR
jgi:hypothetical protein